EGAEARRSHEARRGGVDGPARRHLRVVRLAREAILQEREGASALLEARVVDATGEVDVDGGRGGVGHDERRVLDAEEPAAGRGARDGDEGREVRAGARPPRADPG